MPGKARGGAKARSGRGRLLGMRLRHEELLGVRQQRGDRDEELLGVRNRPNSVNYTVRQRRGDRAAELPGVLQQAAPAARSRARLVHVRPAETRGVAAALFLLSLSSKTNNNACLLFVGQFVQTQRCGQSYTNGQRDRGVTGFSSEDLRQPE